MRCERGQATIEWVGLVLLASLVLGALAAAVPVVDGRSFGGFLSHRIVCAVKRSACGDRALARAYGREDAALLRRHAPGHRLRAGRALAAGGLPRVPQPRLLGRTRRPRPRRPPHPRRQPRHRLHARDPPQRPDLPPVLALLPGLQLHRRGLGRAVAAQPPRAGSRSYPGYHDDDWEGYAVRIGRDGRVAVRVDVPRPLAVVQVRRLPRSLGPADRLDPGLAGEPRGARPARAPGRGPAGAHAPPREGLRLVPLEASTAAATARWIRGSSLPGARRRGTTRKLPVPRADKSAPGRRPGG